MPDRQTRRRRAVNNGRVFECVLDWQPARFTEDNLRPVHSDDIIEFLRCVRGGSWAYFRSLNRERLVALAIENKDTYL